MSHTVNIIVEDGLYNTLWCSQICHPSPSIISPNILEITGARYMIVTANRFLCLLKNLLLLFYWITCVRLLISKLFRSQSTLSVSSLTPWLYRTEFVLKSYSKTAKGIVHTSKSKISNDVVPPLQQKKNQILFSKLMKKKRCIERFQKRNSRGIFVVTAKITATVWLAEKLLPI